jgi:hypothetical protein
MRLRAIDKERIKAQIDFINRITRGGEIDLELAVAERKRLADRVADKRLQFIKWMRAQRFTNARINEELRLFDELLRELRRDPTKTVDLSGLSNALGGL